MNENNYKNSTTITMDYCNNEDNDKEDESLIEITRLRSQISNKMKDLCPKHGKSLHPYVKR